MIQHGDILLRFKVISLAELREKMRAYSILFERSPVLTMNGVCYVKEGRGKSLAWPSNTKVISVGLKTIKASFDDGPIADEVIAENSSDLIDLEFEMK
jgi:hypothetical protein